jgi:sulfatase maturation enzyme AslB (radical SAM superfamily)
MNYELLEVVFRRINEFLIKHPSEKLEFLWHGGELCLLGADYFNKAREIQNKICRETSDRIHHSVQSNLTRIDQDIINAFKNMGINQVGTSYDMYDQIRGIGTNRDTKKYNELFFNGLELLRKNNMFGGVIYVVP